MSEESKKESEKLPEGAIEVDEFDRERLRALESDLKRMQQNLEKAGGALEQAKVQFDTVQGAFLNLREQSQKEMKLIERKYKVGDRKLVWNSEKGVLISQEKV